MREVMIRKHYLKRRRSVGWSAAVFEVCRRYRLDQRVVFAALGWTAKSQRRKHGVRKD